MRGQLEEGELFERYRVVRLLATGGLGEVYEAEHSFLGRRVALKVLKAALLEDEEALRRARVEAAVLSRLDHPNVVRIVDAGLSETGKGWFAMELLEGCTLRRLLHASGHLSTAHALFVARELAAGLSAAHGIGALHRDLKSDNVFVTQDLRVTILDLGMARLRGAGFETTAIPQNLGTPAYMAPEQLCGAPLDERVDLYALGVLLYEMLTGAHPLADERGGLPAGLSWIDAHVERSPQPLSSRGVSVPPELEGLVQGLLARDPARRPASASAVLARLEELLALHGDGRGLEGLDTSGVGRVRLAPGAPGGTLGVDVEADRDPSRASPRVGVPIFRAGLVALCVGMILAGAALALTRWYDARQGGHRDLRPAPPSGLRP